MESKPDPIGTCPKCGANLALVGRIHRCRALGDLKPAPAVSNVPNRSVPNSDPIPNRNEAARVARWKAVILESYRAYMWEYMRRRRAKPPA